MLDKRQLFPTFIVGVNYAFVEHPVAAVATIFAERTGMNPHGPRTFHDDPSARNKHGQFFASVIHADKTDESCTYPRLMFGLAFFSWLSPNENAK